MSGQKNGEFGLSEVFKAHSTYYGLGMIGLLWVGVWFLVDIERAANRAALQQDTVNLARVFEENVIRSVSELDKALRYLRQAHKSQHGKNAWSELVHQAYAESEITVQLGVIGPDGRLAASTRGPQPPKPIDLSDREHFRVHLNSTADKLFISKPVLGRVSKKWSVQLARRIITAEGGFGGVIVASLDPAHFTDFYKSINLGAGGTVTIVGDDGVVRASGGELPYELGTKLSDRALVAAMQDRGEGTFVTKTHGGNGPRIISFRQVRGYPLGIVVGTNEQQPGSSWLRNRQIYVASAAILTLAILLAALASAHRTYRLAVVRRKFVQKSNELEVTLENISQGVLMVDGQGRVGFFSRRCGELLGLPENYSADGKTYADLVKDLECRGEFEPHAGEALLDIIRDGADGHGQANYERVRPGGTVLEVRSKALPEGGFVRTISDITGRRKAEAQILKLARHDGLTELANRAVFRQRLEDAAARIGSGSSFAVHMLDLDRFKQVNDTYGHLIGDKLLMEVAKRLRRAVRDDDIVARIGGDEFALIQNNIREPGDALSLAERICKTVSQPYQIDGQALSVGCSAGIALAPQHGKAASDILQAADLALYAAK